MRNAQIYNSHKMLMNKMLRSSKETETSGKASQSVVFGVSFDRGESGKGDWSYIREC